MQAGYGITRDRAQFTVLRILDCSRETWWAGGRSWSSVPAQPAAADYVLPGQDERVRADHAAIRAATSDPTTTILDVRTREEYIGHHLLHDRRKGQHRLVR